VVGAAAVGCWGGRSSRGSRDGGSSSHREGRTMTWADTWQQLSRFLKQQCPGDHWLAAADGCYTSHCPAGEVISGVLCVCV